MKPVKAWALYHRQTGKVDSVFLHATRRYLTKHYSQKHWKVIRVEIREASERLWFYDFETTTDSPAVNVTFGKPKPEPTKRLKSLKSVRKRLESLRKPKRTSRARKET